MTANEYLNTLLELPTGSVFDVCNSWPLGQVKIMLKFAEYYHQRREQEPVILITNGENLPGVIVTNS